MFPIDVDATTQPLASTERMASFLPERSNCEVEAMVVLKRVEDELVIIPFVAVKDCKVVEPEAK